MPSSPSGPLDRRFVLQSATAVPSSPSGVSDRCSVLWSAVAVPWPPSGTLGRRFILQSAAAVPSPPSGALHRCSVLHHAAAVPSSPSMPPERHGGPLVAVWGPGPPLRPPCRRRCLGRVRRQSPVTQGRRCQRHRRVSDHHQRRLSAMIMRINIFSPITNRMRAPQGLARPLELIGLVSKNKLIL